MARASISAIPSGIKIAGKGVGGLSANAFYVRIYNLRLSERSVPAKHPGVALRL
jgi:hypothetical protein